MDNMEIISKIADRAEEEGILLFDRMSLMMDLDCVVEQMELRLNELLEADNFNFRHDIVGIQNTLNRKTKKLENNFIPRFAR